LQAKKAMFDSGFFGTGNNLTTKGCKSKGIVAFVPEYLNAHCTAPHLSVTFFLTLPYQIEKGDL
jgi:hypothetical protein